VFLHPIALGLILSPILELSLRQSLAMSGGSYAIFFNRPLTVTMFVVIGVLLLLALRPLVFKSKDWRAEVGLDEQV
jgi:putative tricarboxylic transport membrane protein